MTAVRNVALPLLEERGGADALVRYGGEGDGEGVVVLASGRLVPPGADAPLEVASWAHRSGWEIE